MRRAFVLCALVGALVSVVGVGSASAQRDVRVQVEGLQPGTVVVAVLAFANLNKSEPAVTTTGGGSLDFISDFVNMGKSPSEAETPTQVYVYYDRCEDPDQILFSDTPRDDEDCRDAIGIFFLSSRTTGVMINVESGTVTPVDDGPPGGGPPTGGPGLTLGVSVDFNRYPNAEPSPATSDAGGGVTRTRESFDLQDSPVDVDLSVDYWITPWLGAGFGWERMGEVTLDERFGFSGFSEASATFNGFFNVQSVDFVVKPALPIGNMVKIFGIGGVMKWWGESGSNGDLIFFGDVVDSFSFRQDDGGVAGVYGAGVAIWPTDVVGFSVYYKQAQLKDTDKPDDEGEVDEKFRKVGVSIHFNLWSR